MNETQKILAHSIEDTASEYRDNELGGETNSTVHNCMRAAAYLREGDDAGFGGFNAELASTDRDAQALIYRAFANAGYT